jgi:hypothetical protein
VRSNRAALLRDIGKKFYAEASIEQRRTRQETGSVYNRRLEQLPSLEPMKEFNEDDKESSSKSEGSTTSDTFQTPQYLPLPQALIDLIERGYHV